MIAYIIIPAFEPDEHLRPLVEKVTAYGHTVLVVNDGSGSEYDKFFPDANGHCVLLRHSVNMGKGAAIKTALAYILSQNDEIPCIGIMDADGQHLPEDMQRVLDTACDATDSLVLGVRSVGVAMPLRSRLGNSITRGLFRLLSGVKVSDTQTGLRAFARDRAEYMLQVRGERYEYELNVLLACARENIPIREVSIETIYSPGNSTSHFRVLTDSALIYRDLFRFTGSSFVSFLIDYGLFCLFLFLFSKIPFLASHSLSASAWLLSASTLAALLANLTARVISASTNYYINSHYVFSNHASKRTAGQYCLLAIGIFCANTLLLLCYQAFGLRTRIAKLLVEVSLFLVSFLVQQLFIFRKGKK